MASPTILSHMFHPNMTKNTWILPIWSKKIESPKRRPISSSAQFAPWSSRALSNAAVARPYSATTVSILGDKITVTALKNAKGMRRLISELFIDTSNKTSRI